MRRTGPDWTGTDEAARRFEQLRRISIDYGVMEKARSVLTVEMDCSWTDLGSWSAIAGTRKPDQYGNYTLAEEAAILDGRSNILVSESGHLIAAIGVENLVIVHSDDATLICHRDHEQQIKALTSPAPSAVRQQVRIETGPAEGRARSERLLSRNRAGEIVS